MPWVSRHRRRAPYSWFRDVTVRSHYRRPPGGISVVVGVVIAIFVILLLIIYF